MGEQALIRLFYVLVLVCLIGTKCDYQDIEHTLEKPTVEKCYEDLGCFNLDYPWQSTESPFSVLPDDPALIDTQFYLSTRNYHNESRILLTTKPDILLGMTDFNPNSWTVFIVHGFQGSADAPWVYNLENALLHVGDVNVISCDWEKGSKGDYSQAMANARVVAAEISRFSKVLINRRLMSSRKMHLIGHGLGAHIASYVGSTIESLERITGLDPAQYGYEVHPDKRLDDSDAVFVDVIHTNTEPFHPLCGVGIKQTVGHVDFYVNNGETQPGCPKRDLINAEYISDNIALTLTFLLRIMTYVVHQLVKEWDCIPVCIQHEAHFMFQQTVNHHSVVLTVSCLTDFVTVLTSDYQETHRGFCFHLMLTSTDRGIRSFRISRCLGLLLLNFLPDMSWFTAL